MKTSNMLLLGAIGLGAYLFFKNKGTQATTAPQTETVSLTGISGYSTTNMNKAVSEKNPITTPSGVQITTPQQAVQEISKVLQTPKPRQYNSTTVTTTATKYNFTPLAVAQAAVAARTVSNMTNTAKIGSSNVTRGSSANTSGWY